MKRPIALALGIGLMLATLWMAAGTSSRDHAPRPPIARELATAFHLTPSATPRPTLTQIPTPTPLRMTQLIPDGSEIVALLFQYPYRGAYIIPTSYHLSVQRLALDGPVPALIVTGDSAIATDGYRLYPAAFAAILTWNDGEYVYKFLRVQFGHRDARVSVSISPNGRVIFTLRDIGDAAPAGRVVSQQTVVLNACQVSEHLTRLWAMDRRWQTGTEFDCF